MSVCVWRLCKRAWRSSSPDRRRSRKVRLAQKSVAERALYQFVFSGTQVIQSTLLRAFYIGANRSIAPPASAGAHPSYCRSRKLHLASHSVAERAQMKRTEAKPTPFRAGPGDRSQKFWSAGQGSRDWDEQANASHQDPFERGGTRHCLTLSRTPFVAMVQTAHVRAAQGTGANSTKLTQRKPLALTKCECELRVGSR
jgi:hypothetical protein